MCLPLLFSSLHSQGGSQAVIPKGPGLLLGTAVVPTVTNHSSFAPSRNKRNICGVCEVTEVQPPSRQIKHCRTWSAQPPDNCVCPHFVRKSSFSVCKSPQGQAENKSPIKISAPLHSGMLSSVHYHAMATVTLGLGGDKGTIFCSTDWTKPLRGGPTEKISPFISALVSHTLIAQENKVNRVKQRKLPNSSVRTREMFTLLLCYVFPAEEAKGMKASTLLQVASAGISRRQEMPRLSNLKANQGYARSTPRKGPLS